MIDFAGDYFKWKYGEIIYKQSSEQLCSLIDTLQRELFKARVEAYEQIRKIFEKNPNRIYSFEWPSAYEWDSDLLGECPYISYRTNHVFTIGPNNYVPNGKFIYNGYLQNVYFENGEVMVDARYDTVPLYDVLDVERVLEGLLSAKDYNKELCENGFYYKENNV